jgi:hypothetical protein
MEKIKFNIENSNISNDKNLEHQIEAAFRFNNGTKYNKMVLLEVVLYVPENNNDYNDFKQKIYDIIKKVAIIKNCNNLYKFSITIKDVRKPFLSISVDPGVFTN